MAEEKKVKVAIIFLLIGLFVGSILNNILYDYSKDRLEQEYRQCINNLKNYDFWYIDYEDNNKDYRAIYCGLKPIDLRFFINNKWEDLTINRYDFKTMMSQSNRTIRFMDLKKEPKE